MRHHGADRFFRRLLIREFRLSSFALEGPPEVVHRVSDGGELVTDQEELDTVLPKLARLACTPLYVRL